MKLLYIASNRPAPGNLDLEAEITELQRLAAAASSSGEQVDFVFLPSCTLDRFAHEIERHRPDVLHISGHGSRPAIELLNSSGQPEHLDANRIRDLIGRDSGIRLVYISACESTDIAKALTGVVSMAIGTTARIADSTAREAAVLFYRRIFEGKTVFEAFGASRALMGGQHNNDASAALHAVGGTDPATTRLYTKPRLLARFVGTKTTPNQKKEFGLDFGLAGCPATTVQIAFFTDNTEFINPESASFADDLCWISRDEVSKGIVWESAACVSDGDFRLVACALTADGRTFSVCSSICDALYTYYTQYAPVSGPLTERALRAINQMRSANQVRSA